VPASYTWQYCDDDHRSAGPCRARDAYGYPCECQAFGDGRADASSNVTQTILHDDHQGRTGNCLQAALATLLHLSLDDVPHFAEHDDWLERFCAWAEERGYTVRHRSAGHPANLGIAFGPSPRGVKHAVVVRDGHIVWDPHPSRAGLVKVSGIYELQPST